MVNPASKIYCSLWLKKKRKKKNHIHEVHIHPVQNVKGRRKEMETDVLNVSCWNVEDVFSNCFMITAFGNKMYSDTP